MSPELEAAAREATDTTKAEAWQTYLEAVAVWGETCDKSKPEAMRAIADAACEYAGKRVERHVTEAFDDAAKVADVYAKNFDPPTVARGAQDAQVGRMIAEAIRAWANDKVSTPLPADARQTPAQCGHPVACQDRATETGVVFCSMCRMNEMLNDAVTMEVRHRKERDEARASAAMWEREARRLGLEMGEEIAAHREVLVDLCDRAGIVLRVRHVS